MWVYFTVLQMPTCNLLGSTSFGYLYCTQVYRSIFPRSYKIVMELPFSILAHNFVDGKERDSISPQLIDEFSSYL